MRVILLIMIGVTIVMAAFVNQGDTVLNTRSGAIWQDDSAAKEIRMNYEDAQEYCQELSLSGKNDWRLPDIKELQGIVDVSQYKPAINPAFKNTASSYYWSSSAYANASIQAWSILFSNGSTTDSYLINGYYVRCVRSKSRR